MVHSDLLVHERARLDQGEIVVGIDEVGRGAVAGPVLVGAVVLTNACAPPESLNDSKLLTPLQREALEEPLIEWAADWSLGSVSASEIDAWDCASRWPSPRLERSTRFVFDRASH